MWNFAQTASVILTISSETIKGTFCADDAIIFAFHGFNIKTTIAVLDAD